MQWVKDLQRLTRAYREELKISAPRYFMLIILVTLLTCFTVVILYAWFPEYFDNIFFRVLFVFIPLYVFIILFFYPLMLWEVRGTQIDRDMHLFITRAGVLAAAESTRKEMFDILAQMREYRALAVEVNKIYILVDKWNISLERACRFVAETTPSELFADFLDRLAHAVETGEPAEAFFKTEQEIVMTQYGTKYEGAMRSVEMMKEIFIVISVASVVIIVVVMMIPMLTGENAALLLGAGVVIYILVEFLFLIFLEIVVPGERIWHTMGVKTSVHFNIERTLFMSIILSILFAVFAVMWVGFFSPELKAPSGHIIVAWMAGSIICVIISTLAYPKHVPELTAAVWFSIAVCVGFGIILWIANIVHPLLLLAYVLTPFIVPGYYVNAEESKIKRRDENFSAFLRSLGAAMAATSRDVTDPLRRMLRHDFGPLSRNIEDLYKRLVLRVLRHKAWDYFSAESLSELISKFTEMFVEGLKRGGNPKTISQIISKNFTKIVNLRRLRFESSVTVIGILYGLCVSITFILYFALYLLQEFHAMALDIAETVRGMEIPMGLPALLVIKTEAFDFFMLGVLVAVLILLHALLSSIMTRIISGGHKVGALMHFVGLIWASGITAWLVTEATRLLV